ncbi:uncharacterized protein F4822DRAFT_427863 [Hypoxylon trugodes]|uniref:uncharacterized protein n=1 Tax=Hypoxylon trugodes TaxID=326681 RepID=UPI00219323C2|nr:uncharacterized protein F4822DRAFT_427863 [Hypoxylon trugodes]KAI1389514.1 hypothetical protein F4822DRAFT_427863 [Hypoxylon trugodes]
MDSVAVGANWRESPPSPENEAQEKYQCPRCPSSFKRPEHLKRHQRSHDGHKPFVCSICLKRFFRSDILTRHELMHIAAQRSNNTLTRKRACTECARARERCSRDEPCLRCSTKSLQCLYPDDAGQRVHTLDNEASTSQRGQLEEHPQMSSQNPLLLPKQEDYMSSSSFNRQSFHEDDAPFRDFLHTLRAPTNATSSYIPAGSDPANLLYKSATSSFNPDSTLALSGVGGSDTTTTGFEPKPLIETARRASLYDPPSAGSSSSSAAYSRASMHDAIGPNGPRYGQPLGSYSSLCGPPSSASTLAAAPQGLLAPTDLGSRPINLKAYELIASNFKELCLEHGDVASPACSNNISESQRTAQHEMLVKLYYEHFKQQAS